MILEKNNGGQTIFIVMEKCSLNFGMIILLQEKNAFST
ncbi:hypothetical protein UNSWDHB_639 [Dehalobacter sp. UNSWDHB]|nr:hypothetical protein UNSWDHB_639 [Dehalobacter sp. UNSWDHB]